MAFRPNTLYYIGSTSYNTFYEALQAIHSSSATIIKDGNGNIVFTKDGNSNTYHLYQFNYYNNTSASLNYSASDIVPNLTNDNYGKMITWLNAYRYSKAVDGNGFLSNSRINVFYKYSATPISDLYLTQEKTSGGYYEVRSLSSAVIGTAYSAAKVVINLSGITTNLTDNAIKGNNAYVFIGMASGTSFCECGLQLRKSGNSYNWWAFYNSTNVYFNDISTTAIASINDGGDAEIEIIKGNGNLEMIVRYGGEENSATYNDSQFNNDKPHEIFRKISFCPIKYQPLSNLNNGQYFAGTRFKNCYVKRAGESNYSLWSYNSSLNHYAVAYNDEFIDVNVNTEKVNISYKGRNNNDNLIIT